MATRETRRKRTPPHSSINGIFLSPTLRTFNRRTQSIQDPQARVDTLYFDESTWTNRCCTQETVTLLGNVRGIGESIVVRKHLPRKDFRTNVFLLGKDWIKTFSQSRYRFFFSFGL